MHEEAELIRWVTGRDVPCPVCRYNLHGLVEARCPECGAPLHLHVGSDNLHLGPWILAITGPTLGLGFDGVMAIITLGERVLQPPASPLFRSTLVTLSAVFFVMAAICAAGLLTLIRNRATWTRMRARRQWIWGAAIFSGVGAVHAIIGAVMIGKMM